YGEVVDVDLPALALELLELVRYEAPDHRIALHRDERDERVSGEQPLQIVMAGRQTAIFLRLVERLAEHSRHRLHERDIGRGKAADRKRGAVGHRLARARYETYGRRSGRVRVRVRRSYTRARETAAGRKTGGDMAHAGTIRIGVGGWTYGPW